MKSEICLICKTSNISTNIIYEHFETSCREIAKEIMPIKEKLKKRSPWKNQDICLKIKNLHEAVQLKNSCPSEEITESYNLSHYSMLHTIQNKKSTFNRKMK